MDISSPDNTEPKDNLSRRNFLKAAARITTQGISAALLGSVIPQTTNKPLKLQPAEPEKPQTPAEPEELSPRSNLSLFLENHLLLRNLDSGQKQLAENWVQQQIDHYQKRSLIVFKDVTGRVRASTGWIRLIHEKAANLGLDPHSPVINILPALIFVESGGNPNADSNQAKGLCQIKPDVAKYWAKKLGIKLDANSIFNPDINITLALAHLNLLSSNFPDPTLTIWTYHLGDGNMVNAIAEYMIKDLKEDAQVIKKRFNQTPPASREFIQTRAINFINLLSSKNVVSSLKKQNAFEDDTEYYVSRVLAADYLISNQTRG